MGSAACEQPGPVVPTAVKILVAGGLGAGKTTMVGAVSEVRPLRAEPQPPARPAGRPPAAEPDRGPGPEQQSAAAAAAAVDFGRITIRDDLVVYLFGTPGEQRPHPVWDELAPGALGAVVLADTRRLADCFPAVDYFEQQGIPFVVAVNCFEGAPKHQPEAVRAALTVTEEVPVLLCDARRRSSSRDVLVCLVEHALQGTAA